MEPNMEITIRLSGFPADMTHEDVVAVFRSVEDAARSATKFDGLGFLASWEPKPDPLEMTSDV